MVRKHITMGGVVEVFGMAILLAFWSWLTEQRIMMGLWRSSHCFCWHEWIRREQAVSIFGGYVLAGWVDVISLSVHYGGCSEIFMSCMRGLYEGEMHSSSHIFHTPWVRPVHDRQSGEAQIH